MDPVNVFEAVRRATDPYGMYGDAVAALPPTAKEVLTRLGDLGFTVVPRSMVSYTFEPLDSGSRVTEAEQRVLDGNR